MILEGETSAGSSGSGNLPVPGQFLTGKMLKQELFLEKKFKTQ
jgi:hypothetical protein